MRYFYVDIGGNSKELKEKLLERITNTHVYYMPPLSGMCDLPYEEESADHHVVFKTKGSFEDELANLVKELEEQEDKSVTIIASINCELQPHEPLPNGEREERPSIEQIFLMKEHGWHIHTGTLQARGLYRGIRNEAATDDDVTDWASSPKDAAKAVVAIIKREQVNTKI